MRQQQRVRDQAGVQRVASTERVWQRYLVEGGEEHVAMGLFWKSWNLTLPTVAISELKGWPWSRPPLCERVCWILPITGYLLGTKHWPHGLDLSVTYKRDGHQQQRYQPQSPMAIIIGNHLNVSNNNNCDNTSALPFTKTIVSQV